MPRYSTPPLYNSAIFTLRAVRITRGLPPRAPGFDINTHKCNFADAVACRRQRQALP
ncbi:hypothetical protein L873DRAFT_1805510 [Choiromyces venosus 120613-1]|uniref:Uncharacterized protein n=1 Tax=Choiromyces venosus 120613-1 TaxID=1336337 RepID=A0A3N4JQ00_9PEZI|nr:hypothetical protein L873DRAFT_1805510 [Choiromyces venosus 120613-1]